MVKPGVEAHTVVDYDERAETKTFRERTVPSVEPQWSSRDYNDATEAALAADDFTLKRKKEHAETIIEAAVGLESDVELQLEAHERLNYDPETKLRNDFGQWTLGLDASLENQEDLKCPVAGDAESTVTIPHVDVGGSSYYAVRGDQLNTYLGVPFKYFQNDRATSGRLKQ